VFILIPVQDGVDLVLAIICAVFFCAVKNCPALLLPAFFIRLTIKGIRYAGCKETVHKKENCHIVEM
jgi:hypothetical protein